MTNDNGIKESKSYMIVDNHILTISGSQKNMSLPQICPWLVSFHQKLLSKHKSELNNKLVQFL